MKIKLELSTHEFNDLAKLTEGGRGKVAKVPKALLARLVIDHGRLLRYVGMDKLEGAT